MPAKELEESPSPTQVHREPPVKIQVDQGIKIYNESRASQKSPSACRNTSSEPKPENVTNVIRYEQIEDFQQ